MKNSLFLVIPPQQKNAERLKLYQEEALKRWITDLPIANPGLATRLFHDFIKDFNRTEMDTQLRLDALETLKPNFSDIEDYLRARLSKTGFPKGENEKKILEVVVSIEKELTIGYWIAAQELTKRTLSWFQGKNTALAIQRTIKGLGNIVVSHYMMCLPVPDWVWIDLHSLYALSVKVGKHKLKIPDDLDKPSKAISVEESYLQILLLSLTEPSGLMQREVQQVYQFLEKLSKLAQLAKKPIASQMLQCAVYVDEDIPPSFKPLNNTSEASFLYINFTNFYAAFDQRDKIVNDNEARFNTVHTAANTDDKLPAELIDYLGQRWLGIELQGMPCFEDRLDRYFTIGLETTHKLLQAEPEKVQSDSEYLALSSSERTLSCIFDKEGLIAIGSLISFRRMDVAQNVRCLGLVNKIAVPKQKIVSLDFEIQLIAAKVEAAEYALPTANEKDAPQKALLYNEKSGTHEHNYVIADSFLLKDGDVIKLTIAEESFPAALGDKKNIGLGYWRFEYKRLAETAIKSSTATKPTATKQGYDFI